MKERVKKEDKRSVKICELGFVHETIILPCKHEVDFDMVHTKVGKNTTCFNPDKYWCPKCRKWMK